MNYYETMGLDRKATPKDIKKAYRKLAFKYHPDRNLDNPSAEVKFKEIQAAYDVLGDPTKRQSYDLQGTVVPPKNYNTAQQHYYKPRKPPKPKPPKPKPAKPEVKNIKVISVTEKELSEIKCSFIESERKGRGIVVHVPLSFIERKDGCTKFIRIKKRSLCSACYGVKAKDNTELPCCHCQKKGYIERPHKIIHMARDKCGYCNGSGYQNPKCLFCIGEGFGPYFAEEIEILVPAETQIGYQLNIPKKGELGRSGAGDIYMTFVPQ